MQLAMHGIGVLIMAALCGLSLFLIVADERRGHTGNPTPADPSRLVHDISSQRVDPEPLTVGEVFPEPQIRPATGAAPYRILMTHLDTDCATAAGGTLGRMLDDHGCTQVVRAALSTPYDGYQVTAGVFNLVDDQQATLIGNAIGRRLDAGDGSFRVLAVAGATLGAADPPAQAGWHERGHFLDYCVITRSNGEPILQDDPFAEHITTDLVASYLDGTVLSGRVSNP